MPTQLGNIRHQHQARCYITLDFAEVLIGIALPTMQVLMDPLRGGVTYLLEKVWPTCVRNGTPYLPRATIHSG